MDSDFPNLPPLLNRDDETWIAELTGKHGIPAQRRAHTDLADLLYKALYGYLLRRSQSLNVLRTFTADELGKLVEDFIQDTLEKLAQNEFSLLNKFEGSGSFTNWMVQVATNIASSELRRPYWVRRERTATDESSYNNGINEDAKAHIRVESAASLQDIVESRELEDAILACRKRLNERYRTVFDLVVVDNQQIEDVAAQLDTSLNAIYILVSRVKAKMRQCLQRQGFGKS